MNDDDKKQLREARAAIANSRNREKEMARLIAGRDMKITELEGEIAQLRSDLFTRYQELAVVQRLLLQSSLSATAKAPMRFLGPRAQKLLARLRRQN